MNETTVLHKRFDRPGSRQDQKLDRRIKLALIAIIITFFLFMAMVLFYYVQLRSKPARSFFEFQTSVWKVEIQRNPGDPRPHVNLGALYTRMGNTGQAVYEFEQAIKLDNSNPVPWYYMGLLNKKEGDEAQAISDFKKAVKLAGPQSKYLPLYELGNIASKKGELNKAIKYYEQSVADQSVMWNVHYRLAKLYERVGKKDKALISYREAQKFNRGSAGISQAVDRLSKNGSPAQ